jgi:MoaA/NifB/PqqE/SkfB family radical SAM enzyme
VNFHFNDNPDEPMKQAIQINSLALNIATQCQHQCYHCYGHLDSYSGSPLMDMKTAQKAAELFFRHTTPEAGGDFMFFGGEPLLNWNLMKEFIPWFNRQHSQKNIFLFTITNGIALTPDIIDFHFTHGVRPVTVSLNGDYPVHSGIKHVSSDEFDHICAMIRYGVAINPGMMVPHCVLHKINIPQTYEILSFIASLGVSWINLARDLYEDWNESERQQVAKQANRVIMEYGVTIQPFSECIFDCTSCYAPSVMVYPNGDVVDACYCMASVLRDRGMLNTENLESLVLGNLNGIYDLSLDIAQKKHMIRSRMDCHLFHENIYSSLDMLYDGIQQEKPYFRVMDVFDGKCKAGS